MEELPLFLPGWQAAALERRAASQGVTVGRLIRRLLRDYLASQKAVDPDPEGERSGRPAEMRPFLFDEVNTSLGEEVRREPGARAASPKAGQSGVTERGNAMSHTTVSVFESTVQTTNVWLRDIQDRLAWAEPHRAYHALRAVLHALRDRLPVDQAAALAAQLPMLVRGVYYEGWHPHGKPLKERHREDFLAHVADAFRDTPDVDPERVTTAVFQVVAGHVTAGEIDNVKRCLPEAIRSLWQGTV